MAMIPAVKLRAAMRECIEALVAAGQTREQAVVQVRKIVRDEIGTQAAVSV
jgi:hypothetical protein